MDLTVSVNSHGTQKANSSVRNTNKTPNFGSRYLTDDQDVFSQNAWDHVPQPSDQDERIGEAIARQRSAPVPDADKAKYNDCPARWWDIFYKHNADNFFRDRKWLHLEFPELIVTTREDAGRMTILEVGCGVGNAVFPLLSSNKNPNLRIIAVYSDPGDYTYTIGPTCSQSHVLYNAPPAGCITASLWDLSSDSLPEAVTPNSVDIVMMIFVLSALHPDEWRQAVANVHKMLKPGGRVVLRDYGRYDLAQLRFKEGRLLSDNFYIRGDKTRVYFFTLDELATIFTGSGVPETTEPRVTTVVEPAVEESSGNASPSQVDLPSNTSPPGDDLEAALNEAVDLGTLTIDDDKLPSSSPPPLSSSSGPPVDVDDSHEHQPPHAFFSIHQIGVDNRLIVNRKRRIKMHRVWLQAQFIKLQPQHG